MEINNKIIYIIIILLVMLFWYITTIQKDLSRYKNIIDSFISENTKKSSLKKVRFNLPPEKNKID